MDELRLAHAAAAGDGQAFARLYDAYEQRIFTFCLRLVGSRDDAADATQEAFLKVLQRLPSLQGRDLNFGAYLFTAARNASYDVIGRRRKADPVDLIPAGARPVVGDDLGFLDEDPERSALLAAQQAAIADANARLPERQREVLVLRELEELSYDEIGEIMGLNRNAVAQLISRARIRLRDELRGTTLSAFTAASPACERALPLLAMRGDGQLRSGDDAAWLDDHLEECATCRVAIEAMDEAGMSYRAWVPVPVAAVLWRTTVARAAELTGSDWSDVLNGGRPSSGSGGLAGLPGAAALPDADAAAGASRDGSARPSGNDPSLEAAPGRRVPRRRAVVALTLLLLLLVPALGVAVLGDAEDDPAVAAASNEPAPSTLGQLPTPAPVVAAGSDVLVAAVPAGRAGRSPRRGVRRAGGAPVAAVPVAMPLLGLGAPASPAPTPASRPAAPRPVAPARRQPTRQAASRRPSTKVTGTGSRPGAPPPTASRPTAPVVAQPDPTPPPEPRPEPRPEPQPQPQPQPEPQPTQTTPPAATQPTQTTPPAQTTPTQCSPRDPRCKP